MEIVNDVSKEKYDIAVFVTSFNHEQFIEQALDSILWQDFSKTFHIFVNDDASTDRTQTILRQYANKHPDLITLVLQSENQYRLGITIGIDLFRYSNSDFIAFCEADDFWNSPSKLEKQFEFLSRNELCSLVHSPVNILNTGGSRKIQRDLVRYLRSVLPKEKVVSGELLRKGNFIMTNSVMLRRCAVPELLISDVGPMMPLDYIIFSLSTRFGSIGFIDEKLSTYRLHDNNYWSSKNPTFTVNVRDTKDFINRFSPFDFG
jgi:glycosyltransferase involved in cell wall biosynthesis